MNDKINYNEVIISGTISYIKIFNNYIAFGLACNNYSIKSSKCFINLYIYQDLYNIYKDLFYKGNKIFVKGYLNSYKDKDNKIVSYVKVTNVSNNSSDIVKERKEPYIRYDDDGIMVWNGIRCEATSIQEKDSEYWELVEFLKGFE